MAIVVILGASWLYLSGIRALHRRGERWPAWPTAAFFVLGLGSFAWVEFGFLGTFSIDLRWAFSTRVALLLFAVPGLITLGRPLTLARRALASTGRLDAVLASRPMRVVTSPVFAPLFALAVLMVLLTPVAAPLRLDPVAESLLSLLVPVAGLLIVLPLAGEGESHLGHVVALQFVFAFIELLMDALPGILLRLNTTVLDHAPAIVGALPGWFPSPLRDQQLSGDLLWFIAEIADVPVLAIFIARWMRSDKREAKTLDDLSDEEMEELTRQHLRGYNGGT